MENVAPEVVMPDSYLEFYPINPIRSELRRQERTTTIQAIEECAAASKLIVDIASSPNYDAEIVSDIIEVMESCVNRARECMASRIYHDLPRSE